MLLTVLPFTAMPVSLKITIVPAGEALVDQLVVELHKSSPAESTQVDCAWVKELVKKVKAETKR